MPESHSRRVFPDSKLFLVMPSFYFLAVAFCMSRRTAFFPFVLPVANHPHKQRSHYVASMTAAAQSHNTAHVPFTRTVTPGILTLKALTPMFSCRGEVPQFLDPQDEVTRCRTAPTLRVRTGRIS